MFDIIQNVLVSHMERQQKLHTLVLEARDAIRPNLEPDSPAWLRDAFDKLHAVHHGMGGDPLEMNMTAAVAYVEEQTQAHITTVSGQGLRATCHDCGRMGGDHEFLADEQGTKICPICLCETTFRHDHQPDNSGLDDGPPLNEPRKRAELKPADVMRDIRDKAWATRRAKYGERGHR